MTLSAGTRLGSYEILVSLGAGGMGEVYRARDTKLGREVAIKVLPAELSSDPERRGRFEQEARSASALNHPNIITIHDIGTADSTLYIAMELVEGRTLRELLAAGPLPVKKTLSVAAQVAEGLARAHAAGIAHRDLKPENVMVTKEGYVKILDFGLAKLSETISGEGSRLPTAVMPATAPGVVMGTVGYMSPEQASGQAADFRSDQFSFGAILYEMATGKRAFQRNTAVETLSAIIRDEPEPIAFVNPAAPVPVRWIVETCLAKDPEERYASTRDLARDLKQALSHVSDVAVEPLSLARRKAAPKGMWLAAAALASLALAGLSFYLGRRTTPAPAGLAATLKRVTFAPGLEEDPALSPDGRFLAHTTDDKGNLDLVVLPLEGGQAIRIAESEADEAQPAWSPDGTKLAFVSARDRGGRLAAVLGQGALTQSLLSRKGDIFIVAALGGQPAKLVEDGYYPAWSPDGRKVIFQSNRDGRWDLWTVPAEGGTPARLTNDENFDFQPSWSSDGNWIVYGSGTFPYYNVRVVPAEGGTPRDLTTEKSSILRPVWSADGRSILFSWDRNGIVNVWRVPFSPDPERAAGTPARVTIGQGHDTGVAVGRDGKIAFSTVRGGPDIWELDRSSGALRQITSETGMEDHPVPSPDGKTLLVSSDRSGESGIWTLDTKGRFLAQLAPDAAAGRWAPDGREIAFVREGRIFLQPVGGLSGRDTGQRAVSVTLSFSPDGRHVAFSDPAADGAGRENIWIFSRVKEGAPKRLTSQDAINRGPAWSPDGRWIAFQSESGGARHLWVVPADGGEPRQLTRGDSEESHPSFTPGNPDEILFLRDHREICLVAVSTGKVEKIPAELPGRVLLDYPSWSPDGRRIYFSVTRRTGDVYLLEGGSSFQGRRRGDAVRR